MHFFNRLLRSVEQASENGTICMSVSGVCVEVYSVVGQAASTPLTGLSCAPGDADKARSGSPIISTRGSPRRNRSYLIIVNSDNFFVFDYDILSLIFFC